MFLRDLQPKLCICDFHFYERVPDDSFEPDFMFFVRNGCVRVEKSMDLMLVIRLAFGDIRYSNNSLEFFGIHIWLILLLEYSVSQYFWRPCLICVSHFVSIMWAIYVMYCSTVSEKSVICRCIAFGANYTHILAWGHFTLVFVTRVVLDKWWNVRILRNLYKFRKWKKN